MNSNDRKIVLSVLEGSDKITPRLLESVEKELTPKPKEVATFTPKLGWPAKPLAEKWNLPRRHWLVWGLVVNVIIAFAINFPTVSVMGYFQPDADLLAVKECVWLVFSSISWYIGPNFALSRDLERGMDWRKVAAITATALCASFFAFVLPLGLAYGLTARVFKALVVYAVVYSVTVVASVAVLFPIWVEDRGMINTVAAIPNAVAYAVFFGLFSYLNW